MSTFEIIITILTLLAVTISLIALYRNSILISQSNSLPIYITFLKEFRDEIRPSYLKIIKSNIDTNKAITDLDDELLGHVYKASHYFDNLGLLVKSKVVDESLLVDFLGSPAQKVWNKLKPLIENERLKRKAKYKTGSDIFYQSYFEYFIAVTNKNSSLKRLHKTHNKVLKMNSKLSKEHYL